MANGKTIFLRTAHNYDMNKAGDESALQCKDPTLTQQHFKDEVDINTIVERFGLTGEIPQVLHLPAHGDFTGIFDFQTAMNAVRQAQEGFMELPAKIRARFHNDPQELLQFVEDPDNLDEGIKLGIMKPRPIPAEHETTNGPQTQNTPTATPQSKT